MRGIALSLATVLSIGIVLLADRPTATGRAAHSARVTRPETTPAAVPAERLWYGGTLAPIVVEAPAPNRAAARQAHRCAAAGG